MSSRYRDFETAWQERRAAAPDGEPVTYAVRGQTFTLPAILPACVPLRILELQARLGDDADMPPSELAVLAPRILGREQYDRLMAMGDVDGLEPLTLEELSEILRWALEVRSPDLGDDSKNPKAPAPAGA